MTLTSTTTKIQYNGDGSTVSFPITFVFWLNADIKVIHKDAAGVETTWVLGTQYTLTGGEGSTGTLTVEVAPTDYTPASGETLTIKSIVPSTQTTSLPLGGALPSAAIEERLDKNVRLTQQREEELDRSIKLSETSTASEVILTDPVTGEFLRWKADGSLESAPLSASGTATGVDETDTDTTKDKLTSNVLAKRAEDTAQAVKGVQVASAVNQLQVTNSATGNPVLIAPTGTDTNIDVQIDGKGTGDVILGPQVDMPATGTNVLAQHKGLVIIRPTVATVDIDADDVILETTGGSFYRASSVNLTATITTSGANGLDTGSEASSTWYHLWVIYNGTTVASLMSLSATAPTMPSGYTFKGYVGAIYNDASSNLIDLYQRGNTVYAPKGTVLSDGAATTYTSVSLAAVIPTTATKLICTLGVSDPTLDLGSELFIASDSSGVRVAAELNNIGGDGGDLLQAPAIVQIEVSQTIYYKVGGAEDDGDIHALGWEF